MSYVRANISTLTTYANHHSLMNEYEAYIEAAAWEALEGARVVMEMNYNDGAVTDLPTLNALYVVAKERITTAAEFSLNGVQRQVMNDVIDQLDAHYENYHVETTYTLETHFDYGDKMRRLTIFLWIKA